MSRQQVLIPQLPFSYTFNIIKHFLRRAWKRTVAFPCLINCAWLYNAHKILLTGITCQTQHFVEKESHIHFQMLLPNIFFVLFLTLRSDFVVVINSAKLHNKNSSDDSFHLPNPQFSGLNWRHNENLLCIIIIWDNL